MTDTTHDSASPKLTKTAAEKLASTIINDIYTAAKGAIATRIKAWRSKDVQKKMATRILDLQQVKTVWQVEKAVDLHNFYYRSTLQLVGGAEIVARSLADLPTTPLVIQGTIGQGKSILLRYLACQEFRQAKRIPAFIELRRLVGSDVVSYLNQELVSMGFNVDDDVTQYLLRAGRIAMLLDGFDEVAPESRAALINALEHTARRYPKTQIVVSSRPDSAIQHSHLFSVAQLRPLGQDEYEALIYKVAPDETAGKNINTAVRANAHVAGLLSTPLMVALLVLKYRATQSVPEHEAAFFAQLFEMLLQRHDRTKPGFIRPRKSKLTDLEMEQAFDALCFLTRKEERIQLARQEMLAIASRALEQAPAKATASDYVVDIVEITCLILKEGDDMRFIHKSVQEHHAAQWIKGRSDDLAEKFYTAMHQRWEQWSQELRFLAIIDKYRFAKWFFVPAASALLGDPDHNTDPTWTPPRPIVHKLLVSAIAFICVDETSKRAISYWQGKSHWIMRFLGCQEIELLRHIVQIKWTTKDLQTLQEAKIKMIKKPDNKPNNKPDIIPTRLIIEHLPGAMEPAFKTGEEWARRILRALGEYRQYVHQQERIGDSFEF